MATPVAQGLASKQQEELLLGSADTQLNLDQVRTRARDLSKRIEELKIRLHVDAANCAFRDIVKDFSLINVQFARLVREQRSQLKVYIAHPRELDDTTAQLVPEQLATMPLPEQAATEAEMMSGLSVSLNSDGSNPERARQLHQHAIARNQALERLLLSPGLVAKGPARAGIKRASVDLSRDIDKKKGLAAKAAKHAKINSKTSSTATGRVLQALQQGRL